jgi:hypothetical protein
MRELFNYVVPTDRVIQRPIINGKRIMNGELKKPPVSLPFLSVTRCVDSHLKGGWDEVENISA